MRAPRPQFSYSCWTRKSADRRLLGRLHSFLESGASAQHEDSTSIPRTQDVAALKLTVHSVLSVRVTKAGTCEVVNHKSQASIDSC